jgi:uncharacterized oxidoreductase
MPTVVADRLEQWTATIFEKAGAPPDNAACVASHLVNANLSGHDSHGVMRVPQYVDLIDSGKLKPAAHGRVVKQTAAIAVLDGGQGFGQVIGREAMLLAVELARGAGIGAVSVRHCCHTGRIGTYTQMAAREGLLGIAVVNTGGGGQSVAPFGGIERRLATNPISIASPTESGEPIVLDMASSVAPEGKVRVRYQAGKQLPPGWMINAAGEPTTDPADFYDEPGGSLLPLGAAFGYKGYGLAFMIDILAGALSGAGCSEAGKPITTDGMLAIAIDIAQFTPMAPFAKQISRLADYVTSCPTAPGVEGILLPGEPELRTRQARLRGGIPIELGTWELIAGVAQRFGIVLSG